MPLYEYKCRKCSTSFEKLVSASEKDAQFECPNCGSADTERQFSSFAIGSKSRSAGLPDCATGSCPTGTCPYVNN